MSIHPSIHGLQMILSHIWWMLFGVRWAAQNSTQVRINEDDDVDVANLKSLELQVCIENLNP